MTSVARVTEISVQSPDSFEDAVQAGIQRASQTIRNIRGAWVKEQRVVVNDGEVTAYQVNLQITFELES